MICGDHERRDKAYTAVLDLESVEDDGVTGGTLTETDAETREVNRETEGL